MKICICVPQNIDTRDPVVFIALVTADLSWKPVPRGFYSILHGLFYHEITEKAKLEGTH